MVKEYIDTYSCELGETKSMNKYEMEIESQRD